MKLYIYILVGAQSVEYWELAYRTWLQLHVPPNWHVSKATRSIDPELGDSNHLARNGDGCNALQWHVLQWSKDRVPAWFIPGNGAGFWFWLIRKGPKKKQKYCNLAWVRFFFFVGLGFPVSPVSPSFCLDLRFRGSDFAFALGAEGSLPPAPGFDFKRVLSVVCLTVVEASTSMHGTYASKQRI